MTQFDPASQFVFLLVVEGGLQMFKLEVGRLPNAFHFLFILPIVILGKQVFVFSFCVLLSGIESRKEHFWNFIFQYDSIYVWKRTVLQFLLLKNSKTLYKMNQLKVMLRT